MKEVIQFGTKRDLDGRLRLHGHGGLTTLRGAGRERVPAIIEAHVQRTTAVHVLLELGYQPDE